MLAGHSDTKVNVTTKWDGCVHEDTIILTNEGDMTIKQIVENPEIWKRLRIVGRDISGELSYDVMTELHHGMKNEGDKSWLEITLENGSTIKLTEDHEVHTTNRGWVQAKDLTEDDDVTML